MKRKSILSVISLASIALILGLWSAIGLTGCSGGSFYHPDSSPTPTPSASPSPIPPAVPAITGITPAQALVGATVTITGENFGEDQFCAKVYFNNVLAQQIESWSDTSITCSVPPWAETGPVKVAVNELESNLDVIFTRLREWTGNEEMNPETDDNVLFPAYATDSNYNALSLYIEESATTATLYSRRFNSGLSASRQGEWGDPVQLATGDESSIAFADVVFLPNNNAVCVYSKLDEDEFLRIYSRAFDSERLSWGDETLLTSGNVFAGESKLSIDSEGNVFCLFIQEDAIDGFNLDMHRANRAGAAYYVARKDYSTGQWSQPQQLTPDGSPGIVNSYAKIAFDSNNNAMVVFENLEVSIVQPYNDKLQVRFSFKSYSRYYNNSTSEWSEPILINDNNLVESPDVAVDNQGNFWAAFHSTEAEPVDGTRARVNGTAIQVAQFLSDDGEWSEPITVKDGYDYSMITNSTRLYEDSQGNIYVFWLADDGGGFDNLYVSNYENQEWTLPLRLDNQNQPTTEFSLAYDEYGDIKIGIVQSDGNFDRVYIIGYDNSGEEWSQPQVMDPGSADCYGVEVTTDENNNFYLIYSWDGDPSRVYLNKFE
ncbi:MAG: IPT/TIG domain-containing protein [Vulcanimicrobiota bacterium]